MAKKAQSGEDILKDILANTKNPKAAKQAAAALGIPSEEVVQAAAEVAPETVPEIVKEVAKEPEAAPVLPKVKPEEAPPPPKAKAPKSKKLPKPKTPKVASQSFGAKVGKGALGLAGRGALGLLKLPFKALGYAAGTALNVGKLVGRSTLEAAGVGGLTSLVSSVGNPFSGIGGRRSTPSSSPAATTPTGGGDMNSQLLQLILSEVKNNSENLNDIYNLLMGSKRTDLENNREASQQRQEIIRLLNRINSLQSGDGKGQKSDFDLSKLLGLLSVALPALLGTLNAVAGGLAKLGIKLAGKAFSLLGKGIKAGASIIGKGIKAGASFIGKGVSSLFGSKLATEGVETAGETAGKVVAKEAGKEAVEVAGKTAVKEAGKEAAETGVEIVGKKVAAEGIEGAAKTGAKSSIKSIVAKLIGPRLAKGVAKGIPFVGALAGLGFGISRAMSGDWKGAAAEVGGGVASIFPGAGTAASIATDVGLLARDVYKEAYGVFPEDDPLASQRLGEVKKEVTDYIEGNVSPAKANVPAAAAAKVAAGNPSELGAPPSASAGGQNVSPVSKSSPIIQQSAQMAAYQSNSQPPVIINNNNIGGGGASNSAPPPRASGSASTSPPMTHIDRILYGNAYGAGYP